MCVERGKNSYRRQSLKDLFVIYKEIVCNTKQNRSYYKQNYSSTVTPAYIAVSHLRGSAKLSVGKRCKRDIFALLKCTEI